MREIKISDKNFKELASLYNEYNKIYGDEHTVWNLDDLDAMREVGQDFMSIFSGYFENKRYNTDTTK